MLLFPYRNNNPTITVGLVVNRSCLGGASFLRFLASTCRNWEFGMKLSLDNEVYLLCSISLFFCHDSSFRNTIFLLQQERYSTLSTGTPELTTPACILYSVNEFMQALDCALTTVVLFTGRRWRSAGFWMYPSSGSLVCRIDRIVLGCFFL